MHKNERIEVHKTVFIIILSKEKIMIDDLKSAGGVGCLSSYRNSYLLSVLI